MAQRQSKNALLDLFGDFYNSLHVTLQVFFCCMEISSRYPEEDGALERVGSGEAFLEVSHPFGHQFSELVGRFSAFVLQLEQHCDILHCMHVKEMSVRGD